MFVFNLVGFPWRFGFFINPLLGEPFWRTIFGIWFFGVRYYGSLPSEKSLGFFTFTNFTLICKKSFLCLKKFFALSIN
ncbi:unnamed protein product [Meloidogyne enterolobii]|uniref:Uncharacterized protein n=1 Tax=Meloidogyne enterolobii TaxID=390850 RepID=A0ACB0XMM9_MELEN